jgi:hypothetical protein
LTLVELLRALDLAEILVTVKGIHLAVSPRSKVTPALRDEIIRHRVELLNLFSDRPTWPLAQGRSGTLKDWSHTVGDPVRLRDGREGILRALLYDTRSGRCRCRVELPDRKAVMRDPEDVLSLSHKETA